MGVPTNAAPVIIKRKKVVAGERHHGGAWKVAYADFVTAMMAFFMLMWLLSATTEKQRKGIADYFNPSVPINRISGGGDSMFGGDSVFARDELARNGVGGLPPVAGDSSAPRTHTSAENELEDRKFGKVTDFLVGNGGESLVSENAMKHVHTRLTDRGLIIELFDLPEKPLFLRRSDRPENILTALLQVVAGAAALVENGVSVEAHLASEPVVLAEKPTWKVSSARAERTRLMLEAAGLEPQRVMRVTGHADRQLTVSDPLAARNNRIEIVFLRQGPP